MNKYYIFTYALVVALVVYYVSQGTAGITPDSISYLSSAVSLLNGTGLKTFSSGNLIAMDHFPPLYPMLVAGLSYASGREVVISAAYLNILSSFVCALLFTYIALKNNFRGILLYCALGIFCMGIPTISIFSMALSEGVSLLFILAAVALQLRRSSGAVSVLDPIAAAFASLTRYVGVTVGIIPLLADLSHKKSKKALWISFASAVISLVPLILWKSRNATSGDRVLANHLIGLSFFSDSITTVGSWFSDDIAILAPIVGTMIVSIFFWASVSKNYSARWIAWFGIVYFVVVAVAKSFFDAEITANTRMLSPLFPICIVVIFSAINQAKIPTVIKYVIAALLLMQVTITSPIGSHGGNKQNQSLLTDARFPPDSIQKISELPNTVIVYSNAADFVYFLTGKLAQSIPSKIDAGSRQLTAGYEDAKSSMLGAVQNGNAVVAYFRNVRWRGYLMPEEEITIDNQTAPIMWDDGTVVLYGH